MNMASFVSRILPLTALFISFALPALPSNRGQLTRQRSKRRCASFPFWLAIGQGR